MNREIRVTTYRKRNNRFLSLLLIVQKQTNWILRFCDIKIRMGKDSAMDEAE